MKKSILLMPLSALALTSLVGCQKAPFDLIPSGFISLGGTHHEIVVEETPEEPEVNITKTFELKADGEATFTSSGNVYTITSAGTFTAKGLLEEGQIIVNAPSDAEVTIKLNNASITCSTDSPIKVVQADELDISAKEGTTNLIEDARSEKNAAASDDGTYGEGAISAKCDLKLKGEGTLVVRGNYNNGVHTTKDLKIQKENLYVTAINNALKGKDSITIVSGNIIAISKKGDGLKTDNSDISSSLKQKGSITVSGGTLLVDAAFDAIDAAYNVVVNEDNEDSLPTKITAKTGEYAKYSTNYINEESAKGFKSDNQIDISAGTITMKTTDDAIHANYGKALKNSETGLGIVNISGGTIGIGSGDDGIHADNTLNITDGTIDIAGAKEGIEATHIDISGGSTCIYGSDDGVNAPKKIAGETPSVKVSGGFLDVAVIRGDTDGIDSNGTFEMTGGFVVSRGSPGSANRLSTALDCNLTAKIAGGTFIAFNSVERVPVIGNGVYHFQYAVFGSGVSNPGGHRRNMGEKLPKLNPGIYKVTGENMDKTMENISIYENFIIYSNELVLNNTYTLSCDDAELFSWTQNKTSVTLS